MIGGGYGTGRELTEFFLISGPTGGFLGILAATLAFSLVMAVSFELSRLTKSYDYRSFLKQVIGSGWVAFDIAYLILLLIVLAVLGAASGEVAAQTLNIPPLVGVLVMFVVVGILVFYGTALIERVLAGWSFLLYAVYLIFFIFCLRTFHDEMAINTESYPVGENWAWNGLRYAGYSLALVPAILFSLRHIETRRQAVTAGLLAGVIGMLPAGLFFVAMIAFYPAILEESVPALFMLNQLGADWLTLLVQLILFGTFIETGTGLLHSFNERVAASLHAGGRQLAPIARPIIAVVLLTLAVFPATYIGLISLIANGYGYLAYAFMLLFALPVLTYGAYKAFVAARP